MVKIFDFVTISSLPCRFIRRRRAGRDPRSSIEIKDFSWFGTVLHPVNEITKITILLYLRNFLNRKFIAFVHGFVFLKSPTTITIFT